jgi:CRP/FNR family transcriptional regulator, cyclic AMP receptor protein
VASKFFDYGTDAVPTPGVPKFLDGAHPDDWAVIGAHCERRRFRAGEPILRAGDLDRSLLILLAGRLETVVERRGRTRTLSTSPPGSVVGELAFFDGRPRSATVVAATDGELLRMSFAAFETLSATHPRLGRTILLDLGCALAHRLRTLTDVVAAR